ncbi:hypothetical protein GCM10017788_74860 [Amycolatopsis acidiphila]|nr:hypothetical protein GCM10017788_74860 [Amycolatopsis acidiphila]
MFKVTAKVDRTPIARYDYDREARAKPSSHIQIHAHRGAISHLLSQAGHPNHTHSSRCTSRPVARVSGRHWRTCWSSSSATAGSPPRTVGTGLYAKAGNGGDGVSSDLSFAPYRARTCQF